MGNNNNNLPLWSLFDGLNLKTFLFSGVAIKEIVQRSKLGSNDRYTFRDGVLGIIFKNILWGTQPGLKKKRFVAS
jgi:hypothetical protein